MLEVALRVVFSIPSLLGASYIAQHVIRSELRRQRVFARIMFGMSSMDVIFAIYTIVSPLTRQIPEMCRATGFFGQGARLSSVLYNGVLTLYYLMTIRYGWKERPFRQGFCMKHTNGTKASFNLELLMHLIPLGLGWGSAVLGLLFDLYHPTLLGCTIVRNLTQPLSEKVLKLQQMSLFYGWVWLVFGFMVVSMTLMYLTIARIERRGDMYRMGSARRGHLDMSHDSSSGDVPVEDSKLGFSTRRRRAFAVQALLYCSVFFLTWIWTTLQAYVVVLIFKLKPLPGLVYMTAVFESLAGFWNAIIYLRPRHIAFRRKQQQEQERQGLPHELPHGVVRFDQSFRERLEVLGLDYSFRNRIQALRLAASISIDPEEEEEEEEDLVDAPSGIEATQSPPSSSSNTSENLINVLESQVEEEEGDRYPTTFAQQELET